MNLSEVFSTAINKKYKFTKEPNWPVSDANVPAPV